MREWLRRNRRYCIPLPLSVRIPKQQSESKLQRTPAEEESQVENISSTGCYFHLSHRPAIGSEAELEIALPDQYTHGSNATVLCRGKVVRVDERAGPGRVGVACSISSYVFRQTKK
jgi:hypothetical protein